MHHLRLGAAAAALALGLGGAAGAGDAWAELRPLIFGERAIAGAAAETLTLTAPYRAKDDRAVPIGAKVRLSGGAQISTLTIVIDDNPMPVSAVLDLAEPRAAFAIEITMRLNGPSPVRAVVETTDGRLLMTEAMVKTSGLGACAAPPVTDPDTALATLGEMEFRPGGGAADRLAALRGAAPGGTATGRLAIRHPSHSGMQMDQVSLLHIPAHYVETVEVWEGDRPAFTLTGSISLSENPKIAFPYDAEAGRVRVRLTDTDGGVWEKRFLAAGS